MPIRPFNTVTCPGGFTGGWPAPGPAGLARAAQNIEERRDPSADFDRVIEKERRESSRHGGRTVFDKV